MGELACVTHEMLVVLLRVHLMSEILDCVEQQYLKKTIQLQCNLILHVQLPGGR